MHKICKHFLTFGLILFCFSCALFSQNYTFTRIGIYYYNNLKKDEFFNYILPKEKFLLQLVENISTEIHDRGVKGELGSEIGIDEIIPKEVAVMDSYEEEINKIFSLLDDIKLLEKKARQKADLEILSLLSDLRVLVSEILAQNQIAPNTSEADSTNEFISIFPADSSTQYSSRDNSVVEKSLQLLESWKYDRLFNYKLNLMKYKLLRNRLLSTSTADQKQRMFRRYLYKALSNYENGEFRLTRFQFKDIINTYRDYYLDDVLFYYGESCYGLNYLDEAASCYVRLFKEYPESSYLDRSFIKLMYIYYIYKNYDKMAAVYQNLIKLEENIDKTDFSEVSYLMGVALYQKGDYEKALEVLKNIDVTSTYYYPSLYLAATCNSNIGRIEHTISIYKKISSEIFPNTPKPMYSQIRNNAILKLGLIYFDQGKPELSEKYFDLVPEDYSQYDLSVLGKAWSAYQSGDPIKTLENTQQLIQGNMLSQYSYEARLLAAYSKNILGWTKEAVEDLKTVYQAEPTRGTYQSKNKPEQKKDAEKDIQTKTDRLLIRLSDIADFLYSTSHKPMRMTPLLKKLKSESELVIRKNILLLDSLEQNAVTLRDDNLKDRIRLIRNKLLDVYYERSQEDSYSDSGINPLTENKNRREYLEYYFSSLLTRILQEKEEIKDYIATVNDNIDLAKSREDFLTVCKVEIKLSELYDYYNTINKYEVWLRENYPENNQVNLDQWAYYSGYGISDINFARIKQLDSRINQISHAIDGLDNIYFKKQISIEEQVEGLLTDITELEEQIQKESVKNMHKKREDFFNNKYFDRQLQESIIGEIEENIGNVTKNEKE